MTPLSLPWPRRHGLFCHGFATVALALLWATLPGLAAHAQDAAPAVSITAATPVPDMPLLQAAPNVWYVQGQSALGSVANQNFISNAGFVVTSAGVVVVDALGSPALAERLLAHIRRITPLPVTHVIVTHYHADHIYGLQVFKAQGARIVAHRGGQDYLQSDTARQRLQASRTDLTPWINDDTRLVPADLWLDGDQTLTVGGMDFVIRHVGPSHTAEDLVVYLPQRQLLFAGDLVFRGRIPFVGQADSGHWITALDTLLTLDVTTLVPGHGPISHQARQDLQLTRDYLIFLRRAMGTAARNLEPFDEAYQATDWSAFEHLPLFRAANRMNAYNTYLLMEHDAP